MARRSPDASAADSTPAATVGRRRLLTGGLAVSAVVGLPVLMTTTGRVTTGRQTAGADSTASATRGRVDVRAYGAAGNGTTDDTAAIAAAVDALGDGGTLVFAPGRYLVHDYVNIQGKNNVDVTGYGATIVSSNQVNPVVVLFGNSGLVFAGFGVRHASTSGGRSGGGFGIKVATSTGIVVRDCLVQRTTSAGILSQDSHHLLIQANRVQHTLADGIHTTGSCTDVAVLGNIILESGDDAIPVVSYRSDGKPCRDITITGNSVTNSHARGIDVVGGSDVTISGNTVLGTRAAGIMVAQETSYSTFGAQDITITDNTVSNAVTITAGGAVAHGAIMVDCADPRYPISSVHISGNTVTAPRLSGFVVSGVAGGPQDIFIDSNVFAGPSRTSGVPAFSVTAADEVYLRRNTARQPSGTGFSVTATGRVVMTDNDVRHGPASWVAYRYPVSTTTSGNRIS